MKYNKKETEKGITEPPKLAKKCDNYDILSELVDINWLEPSNDPHRN